MKALATTKEQRITGFKAILHLCQVAAGKRLSTWLVSGNGAATANDAQHPHTALASTCMRLTVATTYVQIEAFLQENLYLVSFEAIHCVKFISYE